MTFIAPILEKASLWNEILKDEDYLKSEDGHIDEDDPNNEDYLKMKLT